MAIEVKSWECEYCGKRYKTKSSARAHEKKCFANPAMKACRTCKHAIRDWDTVYVKPGYGQNPGDADYDYEYIYCDATDKLLMHPSKPSKFEHNCPHYWQGEKLF